MSSSAKVRVLHLLVPLQIGELSHRLLAPWDEEPPSSEPWNLPGGRLR